MEFAAIDFETANAKRYSPCSVGIVTCNEQGIVDEYYSLIQPLMGFHPMNIAVHGITERDVADAPTFKEIWPVLNTYLENKLVVAHNASFDMSVIRQTLDHIQLPYPEMDYLCTAAISKRVWPDLQNHKLNTVAASQGIIFEHHHALEDARVAAKVFQKAIDDSQTRSIAGMLAKCKISRGKIYDHGYYPPKSKKIAVRK